MDTFSLSKLLFIFFTVLTIFTSGTLAVFVDCTPEPNDPCHSESKAFPLKIIAIFSILFASIIGVCVPLFAKSAPALQPDKNAFVIVKACASGVILATGFTHVLPDSYEMLSSNCVHDNPWHKFPFTGFVTMLSALLALSVDSIATSLYNKKSAMNVKQQTEMVRTNQETEYRTRPGFFQGHHHVVKIGIEGSQLHRYRVITVVLELGVVVHSMVIGLTVGVSHDICSIKGLMPALCFHQMFEGVGLGGSILQAEYRFLKKAMMVFLFSVMTPFGIVLGIAIARTYRENSPTSTITIGLLNASSAGLLIYMALFELLATEFMGPKLQGNITLQIKSCISLLVGAGGMSLMAKWA